VHVPGEDLDVVESEGCHYRTRSFHRRPAQVDTNHLPTLPDQFRQDSKCTYRSTTAFEHMPAGLDANSLKRSSRRVPEFLGDAK
jgi:hypothetical protein